MSAPSPGMYRRLLAAPLVLGAAIFAIPAATRAPQRVAVRAHGQSSLVGHYILREVNGQRLPVTLPGEDPRHTIQITDGTLDLNADGTYVCRTLATAVSFGLKEPFADTLLGGYTLVAPGSITLAHKGIRPDTIAATGYQVTWTHPVRTTWTGAFLYSK